MLNKIEYKGLEGDWFDWLIPEPYCLRETASACGWNVVKVSKKKRFVFGSAGSN